VKTIQPKSTIRIVAAMLVTLAVIGLSTIARQTPAQNQSAVTLRSIQTDKGATFYADHRPDCAWFVEAVLPGTNDSNAAAENLKAVAATL
jgi:hypothetical protein